MHIKKHLIAGLLVWLPLAITVWVLTWLYGVLDGVFVGLLGALGTVVPVGSNNWIDTLRQYHGLGVALMFFLLLATGAFVSNVTGRWWVRQWDRLFTNIPIVKSIYTSVKKVSNTLFSSNGNAFRKAMLVPFPRQGCWTIAFQTGVPSGEVAELLDGEHLSVYVPTTPNPTGGYFIIVAKSDVRELNMSVDQALTYLISMGAVVPEEQLPALTLPPSQP
ncbi:MAG: DUF502 domain-containing protein [Alphaproteobacteria bacterium]|nr:DUF502 domain-containing protein [Alphaproteobacteria bacterium]